MMLQLDPPLWLITPRGKALCHIVIDYGPEMDLVWVCFQQDTGECWSYPNKEIRIDNNITLGRDIKKGSI